MDYQGTSYWGEVTGKLKYLCKTRWVERHEAYEAFIDLFLPLISCLEEVVHASPAEWNRDTRSESHSFCWLCHSFLYCDFSDTGKSLHVDGFTRSTIMMKEAGATLPVEGIPVTRTLSILRVRNARCMRTLLLSRSQHSISVFVAFAVRGFTLFTRLHAGSMTPPTSNNVRFLRACGRPPISCLFMLAAYRLWFVLPPSIDVLVFRVLVISRYSCHHVYRLTGMS